MQGGLLEQRIQDIAEASVRLEEAKNEYQESEEKDRQASQDPSKTIKMYGLTMILESETPEKLELLNNCRKEYSRSIQKFHSAISWAKKIRINTLEYQERVVQIVGEDYERMARRSLNGGKN